MQTSVKHAKNALFFLKLFHFRQMRNDSDFSNLQSSYTRIKDQLEQTQRDNIALEEKERQHSIQHKGLSAKFKNAKEEVRSCDGKGERVMGRG